MTRSGFRSTVVMQRYGFGRGTSRYLADPLPGLVRELREQLYRPLARIANDWGDMLRERRFPAEHRDLVAECAAAGQHRPTPLILHYGPGDHANLHQDLYGDTVFPLQVAIMLSKPGEESEGGERVFVEQGPSRSPVPSSPAPPRVRGSCSRLGTGRPRKPRVPQTPHAARSRRCHAGPPHCPWHHLPQRPLTPAARAAHPQRPPPPADARPTVLLPRGRDGLPQAVHDGHRDALYFCDPDPPGSAAATRTPTDCCATPVLPQGHRLPRLDPEGPVAREPLAAGMTASGAVDEG